MKLTVRGPGDTGTAICHSADLMDLSQQVKLRVTSAQCPNRTLNHTAPSPAKVAALPLEALAMHTLRDYPGEGT